MAKNNMDQDILKVLFSEQEIHDRIQEMGDQLYDKFHDRNPLFVGGSERVLPVYGGSGAGHPVQERGGVHRPVLLSERHQVLRRGADHP